MHIQIKHTASIRDAECIIQFAFRCILISRDWQYPLSEAGPHAFKQHAKSQKHKKNSTGPPLHKGQQAFQLPAGPNFDDEAIWTRIQAVWWLAKEDIAIHKFESHLETTLVNNGHEPPRTYKDEHCAWGILEILGRHFRDELQSRICKSPYFGIMADETTDVSADQQLIIYNMYHVNGITYTNLIYAFPPPQTFNASSHHHDRCPRLKNKRTASY
jgi:hypothetical protein